MSVKDSRIVNVLLIRWFTDKWLSVNTSDTFLSTSPLTVSVSSLSGSMQPYGLKLLSPWNEQRHSITRPLEGCKQPGVINFHTWSYGGTLKGDKNHTAALPVWACSQFHTIIMIQVLTHLKLLQRARSLSVLTVTIPTDLATVVLREVHLAPALKELSII